MHSLPAIKEIVEFWEDRLVEGPGGKLITPDGWSPEHGPVKQNGKIILKEGDRTPHPGVSYDQQIVWDLFSNFIEASEALGTDADYRAKVKAMRDKAARSADRQMGPDAGMDGRRGRPARTITGTPRICSRCIPGDRSAR